MCLFSVMKFCEYMFINGGFPMKDTFNKNIVEPYFYSCNNGVIGVNKEFLEFTGFKLCELLGKSIIEIGKMLKISSSTFIDNINDKYTGYIFTKSLEAI